MDFMQIVHARLGEVGEVAVVWSRVGMHLIHIKISRRSQGFLK